MFGPVAGMSYDFWICLVISKTSMVGNLSSWECHEHRSSRAECVQDPLSADSSGRYWYIPYLLWDPTPIRNVYCHQSVNPILAISIYRVFWDLNIFWISICWLLRLLFFGSWHLLAFHAIFCPELIPCKVHQLHVQTIHLSWAKAAHEKKKCKDLSSAALGRHHSIPIIYVYSSIYTLWLLNCLMLLNTGFTKTVVPLHRQFSALCIVTLRMCPISFHPPAKTDQNLIIRREVTLTISFCTSSCRNSRHQLCPGPVKLKRLDAPDPTKGWISRAFSMTGFQTSKGVFFTKASSLRRFLFFRARRCFLFFSLSLSKLSRAGLPPET